jgi:hypothetical protein
MKMGQKRHEKVLRRKARMGSRTKRWREARRRQRVEERRIDFEEVFGPLLGGQAVEGASANGLGPEERARDGLAAVYGSLVSGVAGGGTDEEIRVMKGKLNRLYGKAGEG